jgi:hypothetical protein
MEKLEKYFLHVGTTGSARGRVMADWLHPRVGQGFSFSKLLPEFHNLVGVPLPPTFITFQHFKTVFSDWYECPSQFVRWTSFPTQAIISVW